MSGSTRDRRRGCGGSPATARRRARGRCEAWIVGGAVRDAAARPPGGRRSTSPSTGAERARRGRSRRPPAGHAFELSERVRDLARARGDRGWHVDVTPAARRGDRGRPRAARLHRQRDRRAAGRPRAPSRSTRPAGAPTSSAASSARSRRAHLRRRSAAPAARGPDRRRARLRARARDGRARAGRGGRAGEPAGERRLAELRLLLAGPDPIRGLRAARRARRDARASCPSSRRCAASSRTRTTTSTSTGTRSRCCASCSRSRPISTPTPARAPTEVAALLAEPLADGFTRGGALRFGAADARHRQARDPRASTTTAASPSSATTGRRRDRGRDSASGCRRSRGARALRRRRSRASPAPRLPGPRAAAAAPAALRVPRGVRRRLRADVTLLTVGRPARRRAGRARRAAAR